MGIADELKKFAALTKELQSLEKENAKLASGMLAQIKGRKPIELFGEGCLKTYADAVKKAKSLTSMRPTVVKALEAVAHTPTSAAVKAAKVALDKHSAELTKEHAAAVKSDKAIAKEVAAFTSALAEISGVLDKQSTVG